MEAIEEAKKILEIEQEKEYELNQELVSLLFGDTKWSRKKAIVKKDFKHFYRPPLMRTLVTPYVVRIV